MEAILLVLSFDAILLAVVGLRWRFAAQRSLGNLRTRLCAVGQDELRERDAFDRAFLTTVLGEIPIVNAR